MQPEPVARPRRRGVLTLELMVILPLILIVLFGLVEFSFLLISQQAIAAAAHVGAREGALPSTDLTAVEDAVESALTGWAFQDDVKVLVYVNGVRATTDAEVAGALTGDDISVEVQLFYEKAAPDLLRFINLSLVGNRLISQYTTRRE